MKTISAFRFPLSAFALCAFALNVFSQTAVEFRTIDAVGQPVNNAVSFTPAAIMGLSYPNNVLQTSVTVTPTNGVASTNLLEGPTLIRVAGYYTSKKVYVPGLWVTNCGFTLPINLGDPRWSIPPAAGSTFTFTNAPNYTATNVDNATGTNVVLIEATFEPSRTSPNYSRVFSYGIYNDFYGNTNYPEAQDLTNSYGRIAYYVNGESYLAATNTTGRTPKYAVTRFELLGGTLFKLASDLTANGNDFAWIGGDLVVVWDVRVTGIIYGNGSGVTNLQPSNIVGGWTGIVTNWATGMGVNSNRQYFSFGIVTNITRP